MLEKKEEAPADSGILIKMRPRAQQLIEEELKENDETISEHLTDMLLSQ